MSTQIQAVLDHIAKRVVPRQAERERMSRLAERLRGQVQDMLDMAGFAGKVSIQGSYARDTWLSGEADLDIFASFPPTMDRRGWAEKVFPAVRNGIEAKNIDRYCGHPYFEFLFEGIRIKVVPLCSV